MIRYEVMNRSEIRDMIGLPEFVDDTEEAEKKIYAEFPVLETFDDALEFLYDGSDFRWNGDEKEALVKWDTDTGTLLKCVWIPHVVEPEDASLHRDFRWVIKELEEAANG